MKPTALQLAEWAARFEPSEQDFALAERSLRDTLAVTLAARDHPLASTAAVLPEPTRWAAIGHVLDFDDLHMESTTHISVVCVPAVLAAGGGARAYLAAAGVMARLGNVLGWQHYEAGWHATCTAGAPAAAVGAAVAMGLGVEAIATAMALAVPGAGGVQRAFGTDAKSLQVGFAVETGLRAARLAAAGATADLTALDSWIALLGGREHGTAAGLQLDAPAVPGGLAIKIFPACYALQRPITALQALALSAEEVAGISVRTPEATVAPLIHHRPVTGLEGKFSLEYALATALLDPYPGFESFTDPAVCRPAATRLVELVDVTLDPGGDWLLDGEFHIEVRTNDGRLLSNSLRYPPGSPQLPPTSEQLATKLGDCLESGGLGRLDPQSWTWSGGAELLRTHLPIPASAEPEPVATAS
ncbi:MmgE/PrpD family protein [Mycobacterium sp. C31M]